jgi:NAD(P)-dependent dehydrogenase (short-subunit alcohol dehydrogenase family)
MCFLVIPAKVSSRLCRIVFFQLLICIIAVIGAVEELAQSSRTISLVQETFETNFFANVNIIKAALPVMRRRNNGHIIMLTGISVLLLKSQLTD